MNRSVMTVFGGTGFIGRVLVRQLVAEGCIVRVASRSPLKADSVAGLLARSLHRVVGVIVPVRASWDEPDTIRSALDGAEAAINLVSILNGKGVATLQKINAESPGVMARLARETGVERFVQVSALGASPEAPSRYGRSKAEGEARVREAFEGAAILRPSIVFGPGDRFLTMLALMAQIFPVLPVYHAQTRLQPVHVDDVARAAALCMTKSITAGRIFEIGGPDIFSMKQIMDFAASCVGCRPYLVPMPQRLAAIQAFLFEWLPGKLLTRDKLAMLSQDNVVGACAATLEALGIAPQGLRQTAPDYLARLTIWRAIRG